VSECVWQKKGTRDLAYFACLPKADTISRQAPRVCVLRLSKAQQARRAGRPTLQCKKALYKKVGGCPKIQDGHSPRQRKQPPRVPPCSIKRLESHAHQASSRLGGLEGRCVM
jgi:hypothetical protein